MWPCREDPWASCFPRWGLQVLKEGSYLSMNHQQQNSNKPQAQVLKIQQDEKSSLSSHRGDGFQSLLGLQSPLDLLGFGVNRAGVMSCRAPRLCLSPNAVSHPYIFLSYFVRKVGWKCSLGKMVSNEASPQAGNRGSYLCSFLRVLLLCPRFISSTSTAKNEGILCF